MDNQNTEALTRRIADLREENEKLNEALKEERAKNSNRAQHCTVCVQRHHCRRRAYK